jgi:DeoR/GlpR family transcriptional regulator of sugar metabolism
MHTVSRGDGYAKESIVVVDHSKWSTTKSSFAPLEKVDMV